MGRVRLLKNLDDPGLPGTIQRKIICEPEISRMPADIMDGLDWLARDSIWAAAAFPYHVWWRRRVKFSESEYLLKPKCEFLMVAD